MECQRCHEFANTLITSSDADAIKLCPSCWNADNDETVVIETRTGDAVAIHTRVTARKRAAAAKK